MEDSIFLVVLVVFLAIALLSNFVKNRGYISKGDYGERIIAQELKRLPQEYLVLNDLLLQTPNGTTQIDHVIISAYGIFVLETKNYQGKIYGFRDAEYWTQNIYGKKYQLYNPLRQNQSHVRTIRNLLGNVVPDLFIESVVVFVGSADVSDSLRNGLTIYSNELLSWIYHFTEVKIQSPFVIYEYLLKANIVEGRNSHLEYVHKVKQIQDEKIGNGTCPRCGGNLVYRNGSYGHFWGCSNYPRCKFTIN